MPWLTNMIRLEIPLPPMFRSLDTAAAVIPRPTTGTRTTTAAGTGTHIHMGQTIHVNKRSRKTPIAPLLR